jgi:hypothetical protein
MAVRNFADRPNILQAVYWDGSNPADVQDLLAQAPYWTGVQDGDMWHISGSNEFDLPVDYWLVSESAGYSLYSKSDQDFTFQYSEVAGGEPFSYGITGM